MQTLWCFWWCPYKVQTTFGLERRTLGLYIVLIQVVHTALWPLSTFLYMAQLKRHFRNTRAHRSCLSLSRSLCGCLCGAGDTLKARIWALIHLQGVWITPRKCRPQSATKVTSGIYQSPCAFGRMTKRFLGNDLFPKKLLSWVERRRRRKTSSESGSGQGAWPELLRGSGADHRLVLAKCWAQNSSEEGLSLCLTVKDTHSSLAICVPKVKHVLNEARVLRLGQSWIRNSSMFLQLLLKNGANIFLLPGRFWGQAC